MSSLSGKCLQGYHNWFHKNKRDMRKSYIDDTCDNAMIMEYFDSLGIYITPQIDYQLNFYCRILLDKKEETPTVIIGHDFKSRSGAIEDGIKKANKIFNER